MLYDIINPSDPYTMEAADFEIAAAAVMLIGIGKYPALPKGEGESVPAFITGGHDQWFIGKFGRDLHGTLQHVIQHRNADLVAALESVTLGAEERTSLNDIGGRAKSLAFMVQEKGKEQP